MLQTVHVGHTSLADHTHLAGRDVIDEARALAEPLEGMRSSHISATPFGGGVSELLCTLVPLARDVGLECDRRVIYGREELFHATKQLHDAPQGDPLTAKSMAHADAVGDITVLTSFNGVGSIAVNAFQSHADVAIQNSTREGFGLTVTEARSLGRPFIGGNVGGIPPQVLDGETGLLVDSPAACGERCLDLLGDPDLGRRLGRAGKTHARRAFPTPRYLRDYPRVFSAMADAT